MGIDTQRARSKQNQSNTCQRKINPCNCRVLASSVREARIFRDGPDPVIVRFLESLGPSEPQAITKNTLHPLRVSSRWTTLSLSKSPAHRSTFEIRPLPSAVFPIDASLGNEITLPTTPFKSLPCGIPGDSPATPHSLLQYSSHLASLRPNNPHLAIRT